MKLLMLLLSFLLFGACGNHAPHLHYEIKINGIVTNPVKAYKGKDNKIIPDKHQKGRTLLNPIQVNDYLPNENFYMISVQEILGKQDKPNIDFEIRERFIDIAEKMLVAGLIISPVSLNIYQLISSFFGYE